MIFSRYTNYLEKQVEELKEQNRELYERNNKLIEALVPFLRKAHETQPQADKEEPKKGHKITKNERSATCTCGLSKICDDPAELQEWISAHHRQTVQSIRGGRKSWPQLKSMLENQSE